MRLRGKKIVALTLLLSLIMATSVVFAEGLPVITDITMKVQGGDGITLSDTVDGTFTNTVLPTDLLDVTVAMTDPVEDPQVTVLVTLNGEEPENDEDWAEIIFAVDQKPYSDSSVAFTFKLKAGAEDGVYKMMVGGTDVQAAVTRYFEVSAEKPLPTLGDTQDSAVDAEIEFSVTGWYEAWETGISAVSVTALNGDGGEPEGTPVTLVSSTGYAISGEAASKVFTIKADALTALAPPAGETVYCRLTITSSGSEDVVKGFYLTTPAVFNPVPYLELLRVLQFKTTFTTGELNATETLDATLDDTESTPIVWSIDDGGYFVLENDNTLKLDDIALTGKAAMQVLTATVTVDGNDVTQDYNIYLVDENIELGFGDASVDILNAGEEDDLSGAYTNIIQETIRVLLKKASPDSVLGGVKTIAADGVTVQASDVRLFQMIWAGRFTAAQVKAANPNN